MNFRVILASVGIAWLFGAGTLSANERRLPEIPPVGERIRVIIDTDAANEIDDQFAIALALLCPERFDIVGFVAAHFGDSGGPAGIDRSYDEINRVLKKMGMEGRFPVKRGSSPFQYSIAADESEGVDFLIEQALATDPEEPLWIISLGACTNIAAAYKKSPEIKDHVVAFWHGRTQWPDKCWNFNAYNDLKAVRILFTSELPLILFDTGTNLACPMEVSEKKIRPYGEIGKYLHEYRYTQEWLQSPTKGLFDLGDIAAVMDASLVKQEVVDAPGVNWDMMYTRKKTYGKILRLYDLDCDRTLEMMYRRLSEAYPAEN